MVTAIFSNRFSFAARLLLVCSFVLLSCTFANAQVEGLEIREGTGISPEVRNIYRKGADYLAKSQNDNGSWGKGGGGHGDETAGIAALATMAFLSTGEDPNFGKYARNIRAALRFIIGKQDRKGYVPGNCLLYTSPSPRDRG